tara:strand:+ start:826 stop:1320 length:495 start_codon:yes stop_codon:yes gene_type:complete
MLQHSIVGTYPDWETPQSLFDEACKKYKVRPTLDVCATRRNKKCATFFSKQSLNKQWNKSFFMNPPYGKGVIDKWIKYAYEQHLKHNVTGLALIFAKTETAWWWNYIQDKAEVYFIKGRVHFQLDGKTPKNSAPYGSCWVIWRRVKKIQTIPDSWQPLLKWNEK